MFNLGVNLFILHRLQIQNNYYRNKEQMLVAVNDCFLLCVIEPVVGLLYG